MTEVVYDYREIDYNRPGKSTYEVGFHYDSTWGFTLIPMTIINGSRGSGTSVVCFGGTHGNEYEGQVAVWRLRRDLDPAEMTGQVILLPRLNTPACSAGQRSSPLDTLDLNKVFPGDPNGTITRRIAYFVTSQILPLVDVVIDIHSAGSAAGEFVMCSSLHKIAVPEQFEETKLVASLFDTPFIMMYSSDMHSGLLTSEAENMGKITVGTELGLEGVSPKGVKYAYEGIQNVLRHYDILPGDVQRIDPKRETDPRLVSAVDLKAYIPAPLSGVFEPLQAVGTWIEQGQLIGRLYDFERVDSEPLQIQAPSSGFLIMQPVRAPISKGDTMIVIAQKVLE